MVQTFPTKKNVFLYFFYLFIYLFMYNQTEEVEFVFLRELCP